MNSCAKANIILSAVILIGTSLFFTDSSKTINDLVTQTINQQNKINDVLKQAIAENKAATEAHQAAIAELTEAKKKVEENLKTCR